VSDAILLVDHGSRRSEANALLEEIAVRVRARRPGCIVRTAHLELVAPSIAEGIDSCVAAGARDIVVHPYFLGPGRHTVGDIPRLVREASRGLPEVRVRTSEPLGIHDKIVEVVLERIDATRA